MVFNENSIFLSKEIIGVKIEELRDEYDKILSDKRKIMLNASDNIPSLQSLGRFSKGWKNVDYIWTFFNPSSLWIVYVFEYPTAR